MHKEERVVVSIAEANFDVPILLFNLSLTFADLFVALQKTIFESSPVYDRPVENAGILGVGHG